jgi:hypothetical protein
MQLCLRRYIPSGRVCLDQFSVELYRPLQIALHLLDVHCLLQRYPSFALLRDGRLRRHERNHR